MNPPCLCKVDCGTLQNCQFFWLASLTSLLAIAATAAAILRSRRGPAAVTPAPELLLQGNSSSSDASVSSTSSSSTSSSSSSSDPSADEAEEEEGSEATQPPPAAARPMLTADQLRDELEARLADQRRAQDDLLTQFQEANNRQRRYINQRVTQETARLGGIAENLRRRIAEQQSAIREAERTIRDFTRRDIPTPSSSQASSPRPTAHPAPRRGRQTRSSPPSVPVRIPLRRSPRHAPAPPRRASPRLAANLPVQYGLVNGQLRPIRENFPPTVIVVPPRQRLSDPEAEQHEAGPSRSSPARQRPSPRRE